MRFLLAAILLLPATTFAHDVALSWTDTDVVTFNVYRGTQSGGPYVQIASGIVTPSYDDGTVSGNQQYYYVVTASNAIGEESGYSLEVGAQIPGDAPATALTFSGVSIQGATVP